MYKLARDQLLKGGDGISPGISFKSCIGSSLSNIPVHVSMGQVSTILELNVDIHTILELPEFALGECGTHFSQPYVTKDWHTNSIF